MRGRMAGSGGSFHELVVEGGDGGLWMRGTCWCLVLMNSFLLFLTDQREKEVVMEDVTCEICSYNPSYFRLIRST